MPPIHITEEHHRKHILSTNLVIILISLMIIAYFSYVIIDVETEYKSMIEQRTKEFNVQLIGITGMLSSQINETKDTLTSEIDLLEKMLENTRQENQRLSQSILDVEQQTAVQLTELKGELKKINIKSADFSIVAEEALNSVVSITTDKGQGSGAIISNDGLIVTNYHVVEGIKAAKILTYDGRIHRTRRIGADPGLDIAVLKIDGEFDKLDFGDSDKAKAGQKVIAMGNPAGLDFTVTEGIISAPKRTAQNGLVYIQIDVPINPGNSGGALVDINGKLIGITKFKIMDLDGIGFAIPSNAVKESVEKILASKR